MVGSIPSEIRWMFTLFREKGSVERGFEELRLAASDSTYIGDEAKMILAYLYEKEKRYEEAIEFLDQLIDEYPNNPIFLYLKANNLQALAKDELASEFYYQVSELENPSFARLRERSLEQLSVSR
jgi:tetratricopeptide (TPR) repeat protein